MHLVLQGFRPVWDATSTIMTCVEQQQASTQNRSIIIAAAIASAAVLAVALIVWRQYLRTRPRWLRERTLQVCICVCACICVCLRVFACVRPCVCLSPVFPTLPVLSRICSPALLFHRAH